MKACRVRDFGIFQGAQVIRAWRSPHRCNAPDFVCHASYVESQEFGYVFSKMRSRGRRDPERATISIEDGVAKLNQDEHRVIGLPHSRAWLSIWSRCCRAQACCIR